jgi:hypothetical protein
MPAKKMFENIKKLLREHSQSHLLTFWEQLDTAKRQNLLAQIEQLDFAKIDYWVANFVKESACAAISPDLVAAWSYGPVPADAEQERRYAKAVEFGRKLISTGKVAAFVVAGGQATRKGRFPHQPCQKQNPVSNLCRDYHSGLAKIPSHLPLVCHGQPLEPRPDYRDFSLKPLLRPGRKRRFYISARHTTKF